MWLFPWLTWAVIAFVIGALVTMAVEGTYRTEVLSTAGLAAVIVMMGLIAQRYGIGKSGAQGNHARTVSMDRVEVRSTP